MLEPRKAVIAVRRRPPESDPDRHLRLAVAAASPEGSMRIGDEIPIGQGEIGREGVVLASLLRLPAL